MNAHKSLYDPPVHWLARKGIWPAFFRVIIVGAFFAALVYLGGCSMMSGLGGDLHWMAEMLKPAPK